MDNHLESTFEFICPSCRGPLVWESKEKACCPADGRVYRREAGIWRFLLPERWEYYRQFIEEYECVRKTEGRGMDDPRYYRQLPFRDISGRFTADWRIRSRSFQALEEGLIVPLEASANRPLKILDLGAGNCWLTNRLAQRGHQIAAVDLLTNARDGLGARPQYQTRFTSIQAEFERLPFIDDQVDLAIFNASFHYAEDYGSVLRETVRVLTPKGQLVLLDSPVYNDPTSGDAMVREREQIYQQKFGFPSNALSSLNFLTYSQMDELADRLGLEWEIREPFYGIRWALRPLRARLTGKREPARFLLITGRRLER